MYFDHIKYGEFLIKHKLTPNQFWLAYLILVRDRGENEKLMIDYLEKVTKFKDEDIQVLERRGFIYNGNTTDPEKPERLQGNILKCIPTESFRNLVFMDMDEAFEELWKAYPDYILVNGQRVKARSTDKDELTKVYYKAIKGDFATHYKAMDILEREKQGGLITMGIEKWVKSRAWESYGNEPKDHTVDI